MGINAMFVEEGGQFREISPKPRHSQQGKIKFCSPENEEARAKQWS